MEPRYDNFRIPPRAYGPPQPRSVPPRPPQQPASTHPRHEMPHPVPRPAAPTPIQHPTAVAQHPAAHPAPAPAHQAHHQTVQRPTAASQPKAKQKRGRARKFFKTTGVVLLVIILAAGVFGAYKYGYKPYLDKKDVAASAAPMTEATSSDPAKQLADTLGRTIDLPSETPILVTVQDASKVNTNPFFSKTQSGDQVLYYQNAKIAVLYRPSTKKVINYSPNAVISNLQDASSESQP